MIRALLVVLACLPIVAVVAPVAACYVRNRRG